MRRKMLDGRMLLIASHEGNEVSHTRDGHMGAIGGLASTRAIDAGEA